MIPMQRTGPTARKVARSLVPFTIGACLAVLGGCSTPGGARPEGDFNKRIYVGAGVLASQLKPDTSDVAGTSVDDSMGTGGSLTFGYDISHRFSVEGHLASLGEATIDPAGSIGYTVGGVSGVYYGLNHTQERARRRGFAVFGRLGLGAMDNDASGVEFERVNDVHLLAGIGLEYGKSGGLGLRAELMAHETDAKFAQLGLVYRFGRQADNDWETVPIVEPGVDERPPVPVADPDSVDEVPAVKPISVTAPDADGDKVPDARDQCPDTDAGAPVKSDGCPIFDGVVEDIQFKAGSDTLTAEALDVLAGIADTLREYPDIRIVIEAHTDNLGDSAANLQLSKRRAIAVARYLVDAGISGSRLKAQAYGESRPRTTNATAEGRAANRRVEFSVLR